MSASSIIDRPALKPEEHMYSGDRMSRQEFHRLYQKTPDGFKARTFGRWYRLEKPVHVVPLKHAPVAGAPGLGPFCPVLLKFI